MEIRYRSTQTRAFMDHQGRSLVWLSGALGLGYRYTQKVVSGQIDTSPYIAQKISDLLGAPLDSLFLASHISNDNEISNERERVSA